MTDKTSRNAAKGKSATAHHTRNRAIMGAAAIGTVAIGMGAAFGLGLLDKFRARPRDGEHPVPDLAPDAPTPGTTRAPDAFRPDPTAPVPESERDALRPATGPAPSLVENRGTMNSTTAPSNG